MIIKVYFRPSSWVLGSYLVQQLSRKQNYIKAKSQRLQKLDDSLQDKTVIVTIALSLDRVNIQKMLTLKANRVNLGHANFLGVLRGAESKSSVCPAQQCPQMPQN